MQFAAFSAPAFREVLDQLPSLTLVIEHLGGGDRVFDAAAAVTEQQAVFALASYSGVHMKFHGLGEICQRTSPVTSAAIFTAEGTQILDAAWEAFGPRRMLWAEGLPPVAGREGYAAALELPRRHLQNRLG